MYNVTIIIDSREKKPLRIRQFNTEVSGLPVGDYGIKGFSDWDNPQFVAERKGIDDLIGSVTSGRARFLREIQKLRQFGFACILVEALRDQVVTGQYVSEANPNSVLATLDAIVVRAGIHLIWCDGRRGMADQLESLVRQFIRGIEKDITRLGRAK